MPRRIENSTLIEYAAHHLREHHGQEHGGLRRELRVIRDAGEVCADLWALAFTAVELGHWPTQAEYAAHWKITDRTAQRQWARFRLAFPGEESPDRVARLVRDEIDRRINDSSQVAGLPARPFLAASIVA
ncbi:MAG: hypothetical protein WKF96_24885 [Solirubrobacteraceae bacterium]